VSRSGWGQTISVLLSIVIACVVGALWIKSENQMVLDLIKKIQSDQDIFNRAVVTRFTSAGWSLKQHSEWRDDLAEVAGHPVPPIELLEFVLPFTGRGGSK